MELSELRIGCLFDFVVLWFAFDLWCFDRLEWGLLALDDCVALLL